MSIIYKDGKPVVVTKSEVEHEGDEGHSPEQEQEPVEMTRKRFMRAAFLGSMAAFTVGAVGTLYLFIYPKKVGTFGSKITVGDVSQFPPGSVTTVRDGRFYLVHLTAETGGGTAGFMAVYWKCVHLGCVVPWKAEEDGAFQGKTYKGIFHCQCHGSLYLPNGQNFGGPAPRPLDIMTVEVSGGKVVVNTGEIKKREAFEPNQVTKA
jgi:cytochrome b6-f complex iron-sulfur subunit